MRRCLSILLIGVLGMSLYVGYRQLASSKHIYLAAVSERTKQWVPMMVLANQAHIFNPLDDRINHSIARAVAEADLKSQALSLMERSLKYWPYKKYLLRNIKVVKQKLQ